MKRKTFFSIVILLIFFFSLYGLQDQNLRKALKPLQHEVTVTLVVVEVFITDKDGNFVDNLTKDDFELYEDGKRVGIQYFSIVKPAQELIPKEAQVETKERTMPSPPQKTKLVILFDNINTHIIHLIRQWPQLVEMFKSLSGKVEETMIVELNRKSGMRIIQPFTTDQNLLANKIAAFKADYWKEYEEHYLKSQLESLERDARLSVEDRIMSAPEYLMYALREEGNYFQRSRLGDSFSAFLAAVNYIRRFEGVKSILIVSDGFRVQRRDKDPVLRLRGTGQAEAKDQDLVRIFDPFELFGKSKVYEQHEAFEKFLKLINEERLIFYAISPRGLQQYFSMSAGESWPGELFASEMKHWEKEIYSLEEITHKTGGMYLKGEKKYENFIKELGRDLTHFYDISYAPPKESWKGGFHKIEVKVKRPGLFVRYREGYTDFSEEEIENRALASAFISPSFFRDIAFSCGANFIALRGGDPLFWVRMMVPLRQFRDIEDVQPPERLGLMFGINQWEKDRVHYGQEELHIKEKIDKGYDWLYHAFVALGMKLKPGVYETRVILTRTGDRIGGWEDTIEIPDMKKTAPFSFVNSLFGQLREEATKERPPFSLSPVNCSLELSQYQFFPFTENTFKKGEDVALFVQLYNPQKVQDFSLKFALGSGEGTTLDLPCQKIESFFDKKLNLSNEVYRLDFKEVLPGDYQLYITSREAPVEERIGIKIIR